MVVVRATVVWLGMHCGGVHQEFLTHNVALPHALVVSRSVEGEAARSGLLVVSCDQN